MNDNLKQIRSKQNESKNILYKLSRELRTIDNQALFCAQELAIKNESKLYVLYNHDNSVKWNCVHRTIDFMIDGLKEVADSCKDNNIVFIYNEGKSYEFLNAFCKTNNIGEIITDLQVQREPNAWIDKFIQLNNDTGITIVDAHNIIPVWSLSDKQEFAARTIRTKIYNKISSYIRDNVNIVKHKYNDIDEVNKYHANIKWDKIKESFNCDRDEIDDKSKLRGGQSHAIKTLEHFLDDTIRYYASKRNDATVAFSSNLSPYITWGMISRSYILNRILNKYKLNYKDIIHSEKNGSGDKFVDNNTKLDDELLLSIRAFVEELIVRGELTENYVYYNKNYDNINGAPSWAIDNFKIHNHDKREYVYNKHQLEHALTHDELWNAAQMEMISYGKMSSYMRMYWAKKILEWTSDVKSAIEIAIYLNDKYNIDGWCPNGFAGIMWSITGLHDRPWFKRPVYGSIRYMARSGAEKWFDVEKYIENHRNNKLF